MNDSKRVSDREFPIKKETAYFNNASYAPMSASALVAIQDALGRYSINGPSDEYYKSFKNGSSPCREKLAELIETIPENIVFTESATQSINFVANGIKLKKGDTILTRGGRNEHPSNYLPWQYYSKLKDLKIADITTDSYGVPDLSELDSILKGKRTRLVVMSHVLYNLGTIMPVREVAKIAHERNALFFLDAAQSVGNIKVDVKEIKCDFLAGTAAKWLCGPLGLGFFYCAAEALENLEPLNFGANSCLLTPDGMYEISNSPSRLEEGFRNWAYTYGLAAAIELWNEFGSDPIRSKNLSLANRVIDEVRAEPRKFTLLGTPKDSLRTSIIPIASNLEKPNEVVRRLAKKRIVIAEREILERKILRISPHFYNDELETEKLIDALIN